ncbi:MAG: hypothetical protein Q9167_002504 [Letrouitia subvulpina]
MSNGMTVPLSAEYNLQPQIDPDILTGGGAMSPAANDLLPSNLFRDEDLAVRDSSNGTISTLLCNTDLNTSSSHAGVVADTANTRPQTPATRNSRAGSLLSSPQENLQTLQSYQPPFDSLPGSDRHSVSPVTASYSPNSTAGGNSLATSRLAQLFPALHWQRGKSNTHEPPPLGTLKQGQSQSFPRDLEQDGLTPISVRRRRGSHGSWALPVSSMLKRSTSGSDSCSQEEDHRTTRHVSEKRSRLNFFGPKAQVHGTSALSDNVSSRPSSTYSYDQIYGRQSSDSQPYTSWQVSEGAPSRNSPLSTHWSTAGGPWSRAASQRPSVRHGSTSNLSIGSTPLDTENCGDTDTPPRSEQMPIGTRPLSSQKSGGPRLNPTAPNFKSFFGLGESKKAAKAEKAIEKAADKAKEKECEKLDKEDLSSSHEGSSPSRPRLSKDAGSITTSASMADSFESLDHTNSGSAQDNAISSGSKETFIQKFSRKSSSGKFNVPWGKERGGLFSKWNGEPSTPSDLEKETSSERHFGKSADSVASTPQPEKGSRSSLSWPNMRRKSRKGAANTESSNDLVDDSDP